ncbi:hypothetical protein F2Q70_00034225 [Brassica cretica]|uniref:RNase H type-1 domain-containing protein n=1 Tax=Brassica cretica TaxID=69181 RepID=A0A8S9JWA7_BRACR|nr:hypothetical protein F2Q70_00034225 [Brassica cretica]
MVGQLEIEKHMHAHAVYGPTYPFVEDIISKAVAEAQAWEDTNLGKKKAQKKGPPGNSRSQHSLYCWINGAWQESSKTGRMRWIIKNGEGAVLCRSSSNMTYVGSALIAEALAMRDALKQALTLIKPPHLLGLSGPHLYPL